MAAAPDVVGLRCAVCDAHVPIGQPLTWRCPNASIGGTPHLLRFEFVPAPLRASEDPNPFVAFRPYLAWDAFAARAGLDGAAREDAIRDLDAQVTVVAGVGFHWTPLFRSAELSDALGFTPDGGVWVKDETAAVAGSHKARHLFTVALHLLTAEACGLAPWSSPRARPALAIASCGNAALAAATLAAAMDWPISVFVPEWANEAVVGELIRLGARVDTCARRVDDPPGDPCVARFREAVRSGAVPFAVQGPENAWCADGGRTIGWELAVQFEDQRARPPDRLFVQVGGGALAAAAWRGAAYDGGGPRLHAVQTEGCAPLARAWDRVLAGVGGLPAAARHWSDVMWPWEPEPTSAADGILDDETYDWIPVVDAMLGSSGAPVTVPEPTVVEAWDLARRATGIPVSATGAAGLAGLLALREAVSAKENVVVLFSGVQR
jgi:threonine synthase